MRLGVMLPIGAGSLSGGRTPRWTDLREMAQVAEAVGFDTIFVPDHLLFRQSPPGNALQVSMPRGGTRGIWEAWTILTALAESTNRVNLGPLVACTSFRNPALLAKTADTIDEVSGGRLILGLGAGWHEPEYDAFGYPYDHRVSRFEEALQIIVSLLRNGHVDFSGRYYQARECELAPRGPRPGGLPILIGAQRPRMLRLAARFADLYDADYQLDSAEVARRFGALDEACTDVDRDPATLGRTAGTRVALVDEDPAPGDETAAFELDGMRMLAHRGTPAAIADHARSFEAVGVELLTLALVDPAGPRGMERLGRALEGIRQT